MSADNLYTAIGHLADAESRVQDAVIPLGVPDTWDAADMAEASDRVRRIRALLDLVDRHLTKAVPVDLG